MEEQQKRQTHQHDNQPSGTATFTSLPLSLHTRILALAGAHLWTCKAAKALVADHQCLADWLAARHPNPVAVAAKYGLWLTWCDLVEAGYRATKADYAAALYQASQAGQIEVVRRMLALPMFTGSNLQMAVVGAAKEGSLPVLQLLLDRAAQDGVSIDKPKVATVAAQGGNLKALRWLLHRDSHPSFQDILHATAEQDWQAVLQLVQDGDKALPFEVLLLYAIDHLGSAAVQALMQCGAAVSVESAERHMLAAVRQGRARCLQLLLQQYAVTGIADTHLGLLIAVQRGYRRCAELVLTAFRQPWVRRGEALCTAAANGYWRILHLLLDYAGNQPSNDPHLPTEDLAAAIYNAASRQNLTCMRLLLDRVMQARLDPNKGLGNRFLDRSLASAAEAGDWQVVELMTTTKWPGFKWGGRRVYFGPNRTLALAAIVDPAAAMRAGVQLKDQLYPVQVQRQAPLRGGSGSGKAGADSHQGHTTNSSVSSDAVSGGSNCSNLDVIEVEVEDADDAETHSLQKYTPSRARAAVLLIRAGAKVGDMVHQPLQELALGESNEELRQLLSSHAPAAATDQVSMAVWVLVILLVSAG
jgi:hypothetical protein